MAPPLVSVSHLSFDYGSRRILRDVSFSIEAGEKWAIIGKNGVGKSTLVKCAAGLLKVGRGAIAIAGRDLHDYRPRELATLISYVPQPSGRMLSPYTVFDYVMMGRFPYQGFMALPSEKDRRIVLNALALTDATDLDGRTMDTLSGGELQRVFLAGAVAQQAAVLLLDEPATFLDPLHHELVRRALNRIHDEFGTTMLTVTHDVNLALSNYTNVLALVDGALFFAGATADFLAQCPSILECIYTLPFEKALGVKTGRTVIVPEIEFSEADRRAAP